jgi:two-component system cell cycle sensor histidine kinase PleC
MAGTLCGLPQGGSAYLDAAADGPPMADVIARTCHDLRTPLNAIIGFSEIMQRELLGPLGTERYQSYAGHIRESGVSLLAAVERALALTESLAEVSVAANRRPD